MLRIRTVGPAVVCAAAVLVAAAGCGAGSGSDSSSGAGTLAGGESAATPPPAGVPTPSVADLAAAQLPVARYMLTPLQGAQVTWLEDRALRTCMARFGFDYPAAEPRPTAETARTVRYSVMYRRYGISDPAEVRVWGYHLPPDDADGSAAASGDAEAGKPSGVLAEVLAGTTPDGKALSTYQGLAVPPQGCDGEASRLFPELASPQGPGTAPGQPLSVLKADSFTASQKDQRLQPVIAAWQACMAGAGYRVGSDPLNAPIALTSLNAPKPDAAEIAMAEADVSCRTKTDLAGHWFALEADYQNAAIARMGSTLREVEEQRDAVVRKINALMAKP